MNTRKISLGGLLTALTVISLYMAVIMPTNRISLYALSSFFISIVIMESGIKFGWIFYAATSLLGFIVVPSKIELLPYIILFGNYGIAKYFFERVKNIPLEFILKIVYFNLTVFIFWIFLKDIILTGLKIEWPWEIILLLLQVLFLLYDYVYTLFIRYYHMKIKNILGKKN